MQQSGPFMGVLDCFARNDDELSARYFIAL